MRSRLASTSRALQGDFEVYSDVTDYMAEVEQTTREIVAVVLGSLLCVGLDGFKLPAQNRPAKRPRNRCRLHSSLPLCSATAARKPLRLVR